MIDRHIVAESHILLVSTQPEVLAPLLLVIRTILQQIPSSVQPSEVMSMLEKGMFDMILFDMHGTKNGLPLIDSIKQRFPLIPIIAMVPYGDVMVVEQVLEYGADDYISQPVSLERLKTTFRNALRMRTLLLGATAESLAVLHKRSAHSASEMASFMNSAGQLKSLREVEDMVIEYAIAACDGCITKAAQALGIGRSTLYRKIQERARTKGNEAFTIPEKIR